MYHAVVLATGAPRDRKLGIPGESLPGVIGSGAFVGWYNGHPSPHHSRSSGNVRSAVIIGNGNVALDVARILGQASRRTERFDLTPDVLIALGSQPIEDIHIVGRRGAADAKFTPQRTQRNWHTATNETSSSIRVQSMVARLWSTYCENSRPTIVLVCQVRIRFHFGLTPVAFAGETHLEAVTFRSITEEEVSIPAQLAATCIGYEAVPCCTTTPQSGVFSNEAGKIDEGLYVVGWAKRGPTGTIQPIAPRRSKSHRRSQRKSAVRKPSQLPTSPRYLQSRGIVWTDYSGWKRIEEAERAGACDERCRLKLLTPKT